MSRKGKNRWPKNSAMLVGLDNLELVSRRSWRDHEMVLATLQKQKLQYKTLNKNYFVKVSRKISFDYKR
jgi:hypothetical protein